MEQDTRGFDLKADNFQTQLSSIINESNLPISIIYYILKDCCNQAQILFTQEANKQYQQFCREAEEERITLQQQKAKEEEENSSSSND